MNRQKRFWGFFRFREDKTTRTLSENAEGFSQILKEQSGEKGYLDVFTLNSNNLKI